MNLGELSSINKIKFTRCNCKIVGAACFNYYEYFTRVSRQTDVPEVYFYTFFFQKTTLELTIAVQ